MKYRIVTDGDKFRYQSRIGFFWLLSYSEFTTAQLAEDCIKEVEESDARERAIRKKKWRVLFSRSF